MKPLGASTAHLYSLDKTFVQEAIAASLGLDLFFSGEELHCG
jgi:hypothetical protein